jgi:hypothetical protein
MKLNVLEWCSSETHHVMKLVCALRHPLLDNKLQKTKKNGVLSRLFKARPAHDLKLS